MSGILLKMAKAIFKQCGVAKNQRFLAGRHPSPIQALHGRVGGAIRAAGASPALLTFTLLLTPSAAFAEVCDKIRPGWIPGTHASALSEAFHLFTTLPAILLLLCSVLVLRKRSQWGALAVVVLWSCMISVITFLDTPFANQAAKLEGCIGAPTLFIGAVTAICMAMILYTMPRETRL